MTPIQIIRMVLAMVFAGLAVYLAVSFVMMPYQIVSVPKTTWQAVPDGSGLFIGAVLSAFGALVAAFSGDRGP